MARIRSLHPSLLEAIQNLSLHGQFLVERLPLACDDFGRQVLDVRVLGLALFPRQSFSPEQIGEWLDELEKAGWIERYTVDGVAYLRMLNWRTWQRVVNPTPSRLPASPTEALKNYINIEATRILQGRDRKAEADQGLEGDSIIIEEDSGAGADEQVDRQSVVRDLGRIQRSAEADDAHGAAIQAVLHKAKFAGVLPAVKIQGRPDPATPEREVKQGDAQESEASGDDATIAVDASLVADATTPSPAAAFGLPAANG